MSDVYFFDYNKGNHFIRGIQRLFEKSGIGDMIPRGGTVAVKTHLGDIGSSFYIRPPFVRTVVDLIKERGGNPFVTDTSVVYPGGRGTPEKYIKTAAFNGFTEETMGAPVVIADADGKTVTVKIKERLEGGFLEEIKIPATIYNADFLMVLSHVKGHAIVGMGGSVKNMAMGGVAKETKIAQHRTNPPQLDLEKCTGCGHCAKICPEKTVVMKDKTPEYDPSGCVFCGTCVQECPPHAWYFNQQGNVQVQIQVGHVGATVFEQFKGKTASFNFIQDVTPYCDCLIPCGRPLIRDVGIAASTDPVAADKASYDLINEAPRFARPDGKEQPKDLFAAIHKLDPLNHLDVARRLGAGTFDYVLKNI